MNTKVLFVGLLFLLSMLCGIGAGIFYINNNPENFAKAEDFSPSVVESVPEFSQNEPDNSFIAEAPADTENTTVEKKEQYVVTLSDTKIFIYKISVDGSMQTVEERKIDVGAIPSSDYAKLYSGIVTDTLEEAKIIVEDYIS